MTTGHSEWFTTEHGDCFTTEHGDCFTTELGDPTLEIPVPPTPRDGHGGHFRLSVSELTVPFLPLLFTGWHSQTYSKDLGTLCSLHRM